MSREMNAPPPYYASGPKKSNLGLIIAIVVGAVVICCVVPGVFLGFFGMNFFKSAVGFVGCGWSMEQARDGLVAYAKAHGGKFPQAAHWQDDIASYLKPLPTGQGIDLPKQNGDVCDVKAETSIVFNVDLAGKPIKSVDDPTSVILLWEAAGPGRNKYGKWAQPVYQNGPKLVAGLPRGYIQQPISGAAYFMDQNGNQSPIPTPGSRRGHVNVNVQGSTGNSQTTGSTDGE